MKALAGASFDVRRGELLGLLAPNGAGKTTLITAIAGRVKLGSGSIQLFGRTLTHQDKRPEIGVVPQELAIYKLDSARENLQVFGSLYGLVLATLSRSRQQQLKIWRLEDLVNDLEIVQLNVDGLRALNFPILSLPIPTQLPNSQFPHFQFHRQ